MIFDANAPFDTLILKKLPEIHKRINKLFSNLLEKK